MIFILVAALTFGFGLMKLHQNKNGQARGLINTGFLIGLLGVVVCAITFGVFNL
jgi:hypothetical protein